MARPAFRDLFSSHAAEYAAARPGYPDELFHFLGGLVAQRRLAWDCATGNGQAAVGLARHFDRVVATDASDEQIARARPAANVEYRVARAALSGLADRSVDLVTVAQALHWLPFDAFYREVRRVAAPRGLIAAWSYGACHAGSDIEAHLRDFEHGTVGPYWNAERRWVDEGYRTIPFPFEPIEAPPFELRVEWTLRQLGDYLRSWSAVVKYRNERGTDPVAPLLVRVQQHWPQPDDARSITWPLSVRIGRVK